MRGRVETQCADSGGGTVVLLSCVELCDEIGAQKSV